jgi:uncharacterized membrane protein (UPF0127 family)
MPKIDQIKQQLLELVQEQRCIYEDDYNDLCYDLSSKEASIINDWIILSNYPVKKNPINKKYKNKIKKITKNPSMSNIKTIKSNKEKSELVRMGEMIDKLAGAFLEEWGQTESAVRRFKEEYPKIINWKVVADALAKAWNSGSIEDLHKVWDYIKKIPSFAKKQAELNSFFNHTISFKNCSFRTSVADTLEKKSAGLEVLEDMGELHGMFFPFEDSQHVTFHMGKVKFPIDILFLLEDSPLTLRVAKITHNATPGTHDIWSCHDVRAVLEICGGLCKKYNIKIGDTCQIN